MSTVKVTVCPKVGLAGRVLNDVVVGAEQVGLELAERVAGLVFGDPEALGQGRHGDGMIGSDQQRLDLALLIQWWKSLFRFGAQVGFAG